MFKLYLLNPARGGHFQTELAGVYMTQARPRAQEDKNRLHTHKFLFGQFCSDFF
jgi:hypothetical protein